MNTSGALSSAIEAFDQLPYRALLRLALRFGRGEKTYGRHNWRKGLLDKAYVLHRAGHVLKHTLKLIAVLEGFEPDDGDDNAAAIMWGGAFLIEADEARRAAAGPVAVLDMPEDERKAREQRAIEQSEQEKQQLAERRRFAIEEFKRRLTGESQCPDISRKQSPPRAPRVPRAPRAARATRAATSTAASTEATKRKRTRTRKTA